MPVGGKPPNGNWVIPNEVGNYLGNREQRFHRSSTESAEMEYLVSKSCFVDTFVYPVHAVDMFFVLVRESLYRFYRRP